MKDASMRSVGSWAFRIALGVLVGVCVSLALGLERTPSKGQDAPATNVMEFTISVNLLELTVGAVSGGLMSVGLFRRPVSVSNWILIGLAITIFALSRVA